jgi:ERCC4-type nuclease
MTVQMIMVDSREPSWVQELKFGGAMKMVTALDYGDAWVTASNGDMICIERKAPNDLLGSIKDNRLFNQIAGIRAKTPWAYLVVTGILTSTVNGKVVADMRVSGWDWNSVQGALLTVQEMGVRVVFTESDQDYEATVCRLCSRDRKPELVIEPLVKPKFMSPGEVMLTALPGIGLERAQTLLKEFDNRPADALAWLTWHRWNEDHPVAGIGPGVKRTVRAALNLEDWHVIDIVRDEKYQEN